MTDRLAGVNAKIARANKHIDDLDGRRQSFFVEDPYKVGAKRDKKTRRPIYYITSVQDVPPDIAAVAGDVIQNLRSALDHLAYQLVLVGTGLPGPFDHVYFPISDSASKYEAGKARQIKGMRQDAIDAIDAIKPYKGGNDILWRLHSLNKIDKHRLLLTAGSTLESVDIAGDMTRLLEKAMGKPLDMAFPELALRPANRLFPLKAGDHLFIGAPDDEIDKNKKFTFEVSLNEPGIIEGEPVLKVVKDMLDLIENLTPNFRPLLK